MRPTLLRFTATGALAMAAALLTACSGEVEPKITRGIDGCRECGMVIDQTEQACGYVADGEFVTFDSPTCLLKSYEARGSGGDVLPQEVYFADYGDSSLCAAEEITFLLTDHVPTVMESGTLSVSRAPRPRRRRVNTRTSCSPTGRVSRLPGGCRTG